METNKFTEADLERFWGHISHNSGDEVLVILKGHLLVEELLTSYCLSKLHNPEHFVSINFSYAQKLALVRSLVNFALPDWLIGSLKTLGQLRNIAAHHLAHSDYDLKREKLIRSLKDSGLLEGIPSLMEERHLKTALAIYGAYHTLSDYLRDPPVRDILLAELARTTLGGQNTSES